jgi:hypothetical protein
MGNPNFGVDWSLHFGCDDFDEILIRLLPQKVDFECASGKSGVRQIKKLTLQIGQICQPNLPGQPVSLIRSFCEFLPTRGLSLRHGARWNPHRMPPSRASDADTLNFGLLVLTAAKNQYQTLAKPQSLSLTSIPFPYTGPSTSKSVRRSSNPGHRHHDHVAFFQHDSRSTCCSCYSETCTKLAQTSG